MVNIINIRNKKDLITLDLRTKQIRYLKDFKRRGEIYFISLSNDDISGYEYLYHEARNLFLKCVADDINTTDIYDSVGEILADNLKFIADSESDSEYLKLFAEA